MNNKIDLRLNNTDEDAGVDNSANRGPQEEAPGIPLVGIFSVIFGVLSIIAIAPLFAPLALLCGVIALLLGQVTWGLGGIALAVFGILTSPTFLAIIGAAGLAGWLL